MKLSCIRDEGNIVNLHSLLGKAWMTAGGTLPRAGARTGEGTGTGRGGACYLKDTMNGRSTFYRRQDINKNKTHLNQFKILTPKLRLNLLIGMHHISLEPRLLLA